MERFYDINDEDTVKFKTNKRGFLFIKSAEHGKNGGGEGVIKLSKLYEVIKAD